MDKLKIIKMLVFMLTFFIVFSLCILTQKAIKKRNNVSYDIKLSSLSSKIDGFEISNDYGYVLSANKIFVIDLKNGTYKGSISVIGEQ